MIDDRSLERTARSWIEEGPTAAPPQAVESALQRIETTSQERDWHVPWRFPPMNQTTRLLAGMAAIAVVLVGGALLLRGGPTREVGGGPSPANTATPAASPSVSPSGSGPAVPDLTKTFTSARHGYQIGYPATWTVQPATAPWPPGGQAAAPPDPMLDVFTDPANPTQSLVVVSQPLPAGTTADAWLAAYARSAPSMPGDCWPAPAQMEKTTIDGQPAWIHGGLSHCGFTEAVSVSGGRVYELSAYFTFNGTPTDRRLFDALLASVTFDPGAANDSPVASPAPSGS